MKIYLLFLCGIFILGLGLGLMVRPVLKGVDKKSVRLVGADTGATKNLSDSVVRPRNFSRLGHQSVPDAITQITNSAGYFGYSESDREKLIEALTAWYMESPEDALEWVKGSSAYPTLVGQLFGELVVEVAAIDFSEGLELAESEVRILNTAPAESISELLKLSLTHGPEAVLQVTELGVGNQNRKNFSYCEFPDDFDFYTTLNGLADLHESLKEGKDFTVLPSNLLSEWAKQDPKAAWQWLEEGRTLQNNDTKLEYFKGYRELVSAQELGETIGDYMGFDKEGTKGLVSLLSNRLMPSDLVPGYISAADPTEQVGVVADLIRESGDGYASDWGGRIRTKMLSKLDPATRLSALEQALSDLNSIERAEMRPILLEMGHTEQELDHLYQIVGE